MDGNGAAHTANGAYPYDRMLGGKSLSDWVQAAHKYNCEKSGWNHHPLRPGAFGFDNLACSIGYVFDAGIDQSVDQIADWVHRGWCLNYIYWRDNKPYESDSRYTKPYNPIGDSRRDTCARTAFADLPEDEQAKDRIIAEFLISASKN